MEIGIIFTLPTRQLFFGNIYISGERVTIYNKLLPVMQIKLELKGCYYEYK